MRSCRSRRVEEGPKPQREAINEDWPGGLSKHAASSTVSMVVPAADGEHDAW